MQITCPRNDRFFLTREIAPAGGIRLRRAGYRLEKCIVSARSIRMRLFRQQPGPRQPNSPAGGPHRRISSRPSATTRPDRVPTCRRTASFTVSGARAVQNARNTLPAGIVMDRRLSGLASRQSRGRALARHLCSSALPSIATGSTGSTKPWREPAVRLFALGT